MINIKSKTEYIVVNTPEEMGFVNITSEVQNIIIESGIKEGIALVNSMHITSSVFINDEESGLKQDFKEWVSKLAPKGDYHHHQTGENNGEAHLRRTIMGREVVVAITKGRLDFGPWEQIFYGEFDGRRNKRVLVKILGE